MSIGLWRDAPFHTVLCLTGDCPPDCPAIETGLPRDPELREPVWAQLSFGSLEEAR